jgi:hypothetical protein
VAARAPLATPPPATQPQPTVALGAQADGQTVELAVGETFEFPLGSGGGWNVKIGDERIVAPVPSEPGRYRALAPGTTGLVATRKPACGQARSCGAATAVVHLTIVVR